MLFGILILYLAFSGGDAENPADTVADMAEMSESIADPEIRGILQEMAQANEAFTEPEPSSAEKIHDAFFDGTLDAEAYALLSVQALYGNPMELPERYRGTSDTAKDHAFLFGLIYSKWDTFSVEAQGNLRPFVISPKDPQSYFHSSKRDATRADTPRRFSFVQEARAEEGINFDPGSITAIPNVEVSYDTVEQKKMAEWIAEAIRDSEPRYRSFFGMQHKKTEITIVDNLGGADGQASMNASSTVGQCDIKVNVPQDEKGTKTTTVHEFFHCYQFWMNLVYEKPETMWLMEATATWSEHYIYPAWASEHKYDPWFFAKTDHDLLSIAGDHEYALYLWYFFLVQQSQGDPAHVYRALKLGTDNRIREAMMELEDFSYMHRDFALWNWNRAPFARYVDDPLFPPVTPFYKSVKRQTISKNTETSYPIALEKGAMTYNMIFFPSEKVRLIDFRPLAFTGPEANSVRGLQALYKVGGEWRYEDWTGLEKRTFCRELPEENIEMVVLIASNAELKGVANGAVPITTENKCSPGWRGSISVSWQKQNAMTLGWAEGSYAEKGSYHVSELLEYDPEYDNLLTAEQQYFATFESLQKVESPSKECGQMWKHDMTRFGGSGFIDFKKHAEDMPERANGEGSEDRNELKGTYVLDIGLFGAPKVYGEKFSGIDVRSTFNKDCSSGMIPQANGLTIERHTTGSNEFTYEPNGVKIQIDADATSFSGQDTFPYSDNVVGTVRWSYVKVK